MCSTSSCCLLSWEQQTTACHPHTNFSRTRRRTPPPLPHSNPTATPQWILPPQHHAGESHLPISTAWPPQPAPEADLASPPQIFHGHTLACTGLVMAPALPPSPILTTWTMTIRTATLSSRHLEPATPPSHKNPPRRKNHAPTVTIKLDPTFFHLNSHGIETPIGLQPVVPPFS